MRKKVKVCDVTERTREREYRGEMEETLRGMSERKSREVWCRKYDTRGGGGERKRERENDGE